MVSGPCPSLPLSWTVKVPRPLHLQANLTLVSLSCPGLSLHVRDGPRPDNTLLHQAFASSNTSVLLFSSSNLLRLELHSDQPRTNLTLCFCVFHVSARPVAPSSHHPVPFLPAPLERVLQLSTPILLLSVLVAAIIICTVVMVADFHIKKAKYSRWKAQPPSSLR